MSMMSQIRGCSRRRVGGFLVGVTLLLGLSLGNRASAVSDWDYVDIVLPSDQWATDGSPVEGVFDITNAEGDCLAGSCDVGGFDPATQELDDAAMTFLFIDAESGQSASAIIDLSEFLDDTLPGDGEISAIGSSSWFYDGLSFDFHLDGLQGTWNLFAQLSPMGTVDWQIRSLDGNHHWYLGGGSFGAKWKWRWGCGPSIPEPSAALLFCVGFGVVGTATRKPRIR
jgi:hypothetical protein